VIENVSPHYFTVACGPEETLEEWYTNLKEDVGVTATQSKEDARQQYKDAIKPFRNPKDWEKWLKNWKEAMAVAQLKEVPDSTDAALWTKDFFTTVMPFAKL